MTWNKQPVAEDPNVGRRVKVKRQESSVAAGDLTRSVVSYALDPGGDLEGVVTRTYEATVKADNAYRNETFAVLSVETGQVNVKGRKVTADMVVPTSALGAAGGRSAKRAAKKTEATEPDVSEE